MRYLLTITYIDGINLYKVGLKVHLIYPKIHFTSLIYSHLIFYISQENFNILKSVWYMEKSSVS